MIITSRDLELAGLKTKRQWIKTKWKSVECLASSNGLCYSTWYKRLLKGESPEVAASYPPCPIKGRKVKKD